MAKCAINLEKYNAYMAEKGISPVEALAMLPQDTLKTDIETSIELGNMPTALVKPALENTNQTIRQTTIDAMTEKNQLQTAEANPISGKEPVRVGTGAVIVASMVGSAGYDVESIEGTAYVMDKLKDNNKETWTATITNYAEMGWTGPGAKAFWKYVENNSEAKKLVTETLKDSTSDSIVALYDEVFTKDVPSEAIRDDLATTVKSSAGFDVVKLMNDAQKIGLSPYYNRNDETDPNVVGMFATSKHASAVQTRNEWYENYKNNGDIKFIQMGDAMGRFGVSKDYGATVPKSSVLTTDMQNAYSDFYNNYTNTYIKDDAISVDGTYGTLTWKDGLGEEYKKAAVSGKNAYNPLTDAYDIPTQYDPQKYETWTMTPSVYGELLKKNRDMDELKSGGTTAEDWVKYASDPTKEEGLWVCTGSACPGGEESSGGGGGGGGGGGSSSSSYKATTATPIETEQTLYIECNVNDALVIDKTTGIEFGKVNTALKEKKGTYTIQVKATGYVTKETVIELANYPVTKTITLMKVPVSISTFINGIGGISELTRTNYFALYCIFKSRVTSNYNWRTLGDSVMKLSVNVIPSKLTTEDMLYLYHILNGESGEAQKLVDDGLVILTDNPIVNKIEET
jgi:uncharacterized membrane protein YgcG